MENDFDVFLDNVLVHVNQFQVNNDYVVLVLLIVYQENKMDLMLYKNLNYLIVLLLENLNDVVLLLVHDLIHLKNHLMKKLFDYDLLVKFLLFHLINDVHYQDQFLLIYFVDLVLFHHQLNKDF